MNFKHKLLLGIIALLSVGSAERWVLHPERYNAPEPPAKAQQPVKERVSTSDQGELVFHAQRSIKSRLKSPGSADFSRATVTVKDSVYTVRGSVDSQNGFGAMVPTAYQCQFGKTGDNWTLVEPCVLLTR